MLKSFQNYIDFKEAAGSDINRLILPVNFKGLVFLLNQIEGDVLRAGLLDWVLGAGLMEASLNREKLCLEVQAWIENYVKPIKLSAKQKQRGSVSNMKFEMARSSYAVQGRGIDDTEILPQDLFSPEAWNRILIGGVPILEKVRLGNNLGIEEYYRMKYEPKTATLETGEEINLEKVYDFAKTKGYPKFEYGGREGFIQFIEKGNWKKKSERFDRLSNPNSQFGPSVRPDPTVWKDPELSTKSLEKIRRKSSEGFRSVYHFEDGPYANKGYTADVRYVLDRMKVRSKQIFRQHGENEESLKKELGFLRSQLDIPKFEDFLSKMKEKGIQIQLSSSNIILYSIGIKRLNKKSKKDKEIIENILKIMTSYRIDEEALKNYLKEPKKDLAWADIVISGAKRMAIKDIAGEDHTIDYITLKRAIEFALSKKRFKFLSYWRKKDGTIVELDATKLNDVEKIDNFLLFKFTKDQIKELLQLIFGEVENKQEPKILTRFSLGSNYIIKKSPKIKEVNFSPNSKIIIKDLLNYSIGESSELIDFIEKRTIRSFGLRDTGEDSPIVPGIVTKTLSNYGYEIKDHNLIMMKINSADMKPLNDDNGGKLLKLLGEKGFIWQKPTGKEDWPNPFFGYFVQKGKKDAGEDITKDVEEQYPVVARGILTNGIRNYEVRLDQTKNKFYIMVPKKEKNQEPLSRKQLLAGTRGGKTVLAGVDQVVGGGNEQYGHIGQASPAGKKDWNKLLEALRSGIEIDEKGKIIKPHLGEAEFGKDGTIKNSGPWTDMTQLPSIRYGIAQAKWEFNRGKTGMEATFEKIKSFLGGGDRGVRRYPSDYYPDDWLVEQAIEALRIYSGYPQFQVGLISQKDWNNFVNVRKQKHDDRGAGKVINLLDELRISIKGGSSYGIGDPDEDGAYEDGILGKYSSEDLMAALDDALEDEKTTTQDEKNENDKKFEDFLSKMKEKGIQIKLSSSNIILYFINNDLIGIKQLNKKSKEDKEIIKNILKIMTSYGIDEETLKNYLKNKRDQNTNLYSIIASLYQADLLDIDPEELKKDIDESPYLVKKIKNTVRELQDIIRESKKESLKSKNVIFIDNFFDKKLKEAGYEDDQKQKWMMSILRNAYLFRKRMVVGYVRKRMDELFNKFKDKGVAASLDAEKAGAEGEGSSMAASIDSDANKRRIDFRSDYLSPDASADDLTPEDILQMYPQGGQDIEFKRGGGAVKRRIPQGRLAKLKTLQSPQAASPQAASPQQQSRLARLQALKQSPQPTVSQPTVPQQQSRLARLQALQTGRTKTEHYFNLLSFHNWRNKLKNETIGTYAIIKKRPRKGAGFNIWGAAGEPAVSIAGDADTSQTDPTGKKDARRQ